MYEWYIKKLNEFIQVARYCRHPVIEAHLVLTHSATHEYLGSGDPQSKDALHHVIRLSAEQAMRDGYEATANQLLSVAETLTAESKKTADIVALHFPEYSRNTA